MPNPIQIQAPAIDLLKQPKAPKDFKVKLSGDGSADYTLRRDILGIGGVIKDPFQAFLVSTDAEGKKTGHPIFDPRTAGVDYSAADNKVDKESTFSLDIGHGAQHRARLNGNDTLTLSNNDRAPTVTIPGKTLMATELPIRSSTITIKASGENNIVKIAKGFTGTIIIKNPANTKVLNADGEEIPLKDTQTTLYFNGKHSLSGGIEIPAREPVKPNEPRFRLLQAA